MVTDPVPHIINKQKQNPPPTGIRATKNMKKNHHIKNYDEDIFMPQFDLDNDDIIMVNYDPDVYKMSGPDQRNRIIAGGLAVSGFVALLKFLAKLL